MAEFAIEIRNVAKRFGSHRVLDSVTLTVPQGQTFAFLGRNGAGKTTTIRMLLGLLKPDSGDVRVLGIDPATDPLSVRQSVGFMAEDQVMFGWMRVAETISFIASFYPGWDADLAARYLRQFELPPRTRVKHLSKGQNVRLALLLALAHRPKLVILDDPTLGLDPIMRKEFIRDVIEHLQGSGATVFFSSHLLYEIEPVADSVAILDHGRIVRQASTEELREGVKRLIMPAREYDSIGALPGTLDIRRNGNQVAVVVENAETALSTVGTSGTRPEIVELNLDEIFEAYVIGKRDEQGHSQPALERVA